jgi:hypothetical protein
MPLPLSKDDKVEICATFSGAFILGASFAKELFMRGNFELRIFFFGLSSLALFMIVSFIADIRIKIFNTSKKVLSLSLITLAFLGTYSAVKLFSDQFQWIKLTTDIKQEALFFIVSYTLSTDVLYVLNKDQLEDALRRKTTLKYLLAPINGIAFGTILSWVLMWWTLNTVQ